MIEGEGRAGGDSKVSYYKTISEMDPLKMLTTVL